MRIINPDVFIEAKLRFNARAQQKQIDRIWTILRDRCFSNSHELRGVFPTAERFPGASNTYRFDIGGRKGLRMVAVIRFRNGSVFIHMIGDHDDYDRFSL